MCDCCTSALQHAVGKHRNLAQMTTLSQFTPHQVGTSGRWNMYYSRLTMTSIFRAQSMLWRVDWFWKPRKCSLCSFSFTSIKRFISIFILWIVWGSSLASVNKLNVCVHRFCQALCITGLPLSHKADNYTFTKAGNESEPLNPIAIFSAKSIPTVPRTLLFLSHSLGKCPTL